jgi:AcrR family transcriptional regulator
MSKDSFSDRIIEKAAEVFNQFGYKKTTMDEIAQQLGKGKSSIYYYYTSKEEIFEAVVEKEANQLRNEVKNSIEQAIEPIGKIKNYILTRVSVYKRVTNFYNALKNDGLLHLDFIDSLRKKYENSEIELLQQILDEGVKEGKFKLTDTYLASVAIVTALKGLEETFNNSTDQQLMESRLDNLLNILFYGLIVR